jgi:hypothetical protein
MNTGSPNGLGTGYFLIQHKLQLGWKYIWKIKVFKSGEGGFNYLLFYVSDLAPWIGPVEDVEEQLEDLHMAARRKRHLSKAKAFSPDTAFIHKMWTARGWFESTR